VQTEVYQIGDWLVHHEGLQLLLPEGFFESKSSQPSINKITVEPKSPCAGPPDMKEIEKRLADDKTFVNAEMLLKEDHKLKLRQVEDEKAYDSARTGIVNLASNRGFCDLSTVKSELDYLQELRTVAMLQRIPEVVDEEFRQGDIGMPKAMFTIGLSHIRQIVQGLVEGKIRVAMPPVLLAAAKKNGDNDPVSDTELNLCKENFGVTVILPRTLADNQKVLTLMGLDKIVTRARSQSPPLVLSAIH